MHCASCVSSVERALQAIPGVHTARVNLPLAQAAVDYEPGKTDLARMSAAVASAGYSARPAEQSGKSAGAVLEEKSRHEAQTWLIRLILAAVLLVPLMAAEYL